MPPRRDGRKSNETRPLSLIFEGLARADGSARFGFGNISALASVSGPMEVRLASEHPSKAAFEVLIRPLTNVPATESKAIASTIRSTLEPSLILTKNPRSLVQLVIQALSPSSIYAWDTALAAAMINAASLAFLNASSIPMNGVVAAVAICRTSAGELVVDPTDEELETARSHGCFAFLFADGVGSNGNHSNCVWSNWRSVRDGFDEEEFLSAKALSRESAQSVHRSMRTSVAKILGVDLALGEGLESDDDKMII